MRSGKKQRVTFIECPSSVTSMSNLAKIADLVLCIVDASIGFEMETFEFLSMMQIHGFPRCIGVLNHLDFYQGDKKLRKLKKVMKKRFASETSPDCRLFYLTGLKNGSYLHREVSNLAR